MKSTTAVILLLIAAGLVYTVVMPEYSKVQDLRAEAASYNDVLSQVTDISQKRDQLQLKFQAIPQDELNALQQILPDNVNVVELALDLDTIASKYGLSVKSIKIKDSDPASSPATINAPTTGPYDKVNLLFSVLGTYENFKRFVGDLETSERLIEVRAVNFEASSQTPVNMYNLEIETYWLK